MKGMALIHLAAQCRPPLTEAALCAWVGQATPGDRLAYHQGYLAIDTAADSLFGSPAERRSLRALADRAWKLAEDGLVHLVQRREADRDYTYLVVARRRPRAAGGALQTVLEQAGLADPPSIRRSA